MTEKGAYFEISFLPSRDFAVPGDVKTQLGLWLPKANARTVRALKARPVDLVGVDKAAMLVLPPVAPACGFAGRVRAPRDYYVRVLGNDYSVHPAAIGRIVDVVADLGADRRGRSVVLGASWLEPVWDAHADREVQQFAPARGRPRSAFGRMAARTALTREPPEDRAGWPPCDSDESGESDGRHRRRVGRSHRTTRSVSTSVAATVTVRAISRPQPRPRLACSRR